ncbi:MAG: murein transglycosylase A [Minwuia sp.]|uniref:murein transglycosylase A n=1 Tax=Minwuia sp. TaxID=2493630 RepID=UPI003A87C991
MKRAAPLLFLLVVIALAAVFAWYLFRDKAPEVAEPSVAFERVDIAALPGWNADDLSGFRKALDTSCARWPRRTNPLGPAMAAACAALPHGDAALKQHLVANWVAWRVAADDGKLTGYFEPVYPGSRDPGDGYETPLYAVPDDLISADLKDFDPDLGSRTIRGRLDGKQLIPYFDRKAIRQGALGGRDLELMWLADPVDAFFLEIQGSGRIALPDGSVAYVGYASQNGHAYRAIGRDLIQQNLVPREKISMQTIRDWLSANAARANEIMDLNRSYVFFTERDVEGAIGAEGVVLTPERSIAIDRRLWYFGLPFWIDGGRPDLQRLMMGQDTGGAIRGAARADYFAGPGDAAGDKAGAMNEPLGLWVLLPDGVPPETALR